MKKFLALLVMVPVFAFGNSGPAIEPGVSKALAQHRAKVLTNIHYRLHFNIPPDDISPIAARAEISFDLEDNQVPLQLDFREDAAFIQSVAIDGEAVPYEFRDEHIVLSPKVLRTGRNTVELQFTAGSSSLNRNPDFLYTLFVPDRARTAFPLFDQPDLKARYSLTLEVSDDWVTMANAPIKRLEREDGRTTYHFEQTDLISSYVFSFVAGKFQSITRTVAGRPMTMLHRETDLEIVQHNVDDIFELHARALAWMEDYTGIKYPYAKLDFVLIPAFPYGGMEHVGAIQYTARAMFLGKSASDNERLSRASLISHEVAHMWFGNLVTMRWFNDVWTKEVFANFMAAKLMNPNFPEIDHELSFLTSHYPSAYGIDRSEAPNPIRQELNNLNEAGQMYGDIIYHKAPIMMRQLELLMGADKLQQGLRQYLQDYGFANATWPELIDILDEKLDEDLGTWSEVWVNDNGRPIFTLSGDEPSGPLLKQQDPAGEARTWPQAFSVQTATSDQLYSQKITVGKEPVQLATHGAPMDAIRVFNADGRGYGLFPASLRDLAQWDRLTQVAKGSLLINLYDNVLDGNTVAADSYYLALLQLIPVGEDQLLLQLMLDQLNRLHISFLSREQRSNHLAQLESTLWSTLRSRPDSGAKKALFKTFAQLAQSEGSVKTLRAIWLESTTIEGLALDEPDFIDLAQTLAIRQPQQAGRIVETQLKRTQNPDDKRRLQFLADSLSPDPALRDQFFASLLNEDSRQVERWVLDALKNLHHPSRAEHSQKYIKPSLEVLAEIQRTGDIFFPSDWLYQTLINHHSQEAADEVRMFLAQNPQYNAQLRMKILQSGDLLFRASALHAN